MNQSGNALLVNPHPCGHIVYPYADEAQVVAAVGLFASSGLKNGEAVILVMTQDHFRPVLAGLVGEGFDLHSLEAAGQLVCLDANALLSELMVDGLPSERVFNTRLGGVIEAARNSVGNGRPGRVRVFGEMVSLLWSSKRQRAAERLEEFWNRAIEKYSIALLCSYDLCGPAPEPLSPAVLNRHSHVHA